MYVLFIYDYMFDKLYLNVTGIIRHSYKILSSILRSLPVTDGQTDRSTLKLNTENLCFLKVLNVSLRLLTGMEGYSI